MEQPKRPLDENYSWQEIYERVIKRIPKLKTTSGFRNWFFSNENKGYLFDPNLIARAFKIYQDMNNKDKDHFAELTGKEGSGKSTLGVQTCSWIDPNFSVENVCFTPQQYVTRLKEVRKGSCLLLDEGGVTLYSRESLSLNNITMTKLFMLQRQKNVSCILCCPSYWDIDAYIRRHRIDTLIRVMKQPIGAYCGYLPKAIGIINELGYKKLPLTHIKVPNGSFWHGKFRKVFPKTVDRPEYLKRKKEHLEEFMNSIELDFGKPKFIKAYEVAKQLGLTSAQMISRISSGTVPARKIGTNWFISMEDYDKMLGKQV